jgi:parvulin-like peptidyl-prolyl isomerase
MTVSNRQLSILAVVAVAMLLVTIVLYGVKCEPEAEFQTGALLVQGLEPDKVAKITIKKGDDTVTLERTDAGFAVAERDAYPASVKKVNELFIDCLGIRLADKVTSSADNHKDLGVAKDSDDAVFVTFYGGPPEAEDEEKPATEAEAETKEQSPKPLLGIVIGKSSERGSGSHVRLLDSDVVYTSEKGVYLSTGVSSYIDTEICDIKKDDVEEARVALADESYTVLRNKDKKIVLAEIPEGKKQKDYDVEAVLDALSYLTFSDVVIEPPADLAFDATYVARTKKHLTYTIRLAAKGDKHYAKVAVRGPSAAELKQAGLIGRDDPKEKLEEKSAILSAADKADELNKLHSQWIYELDKWKAEKMRKPLADLLEDDKPEEPEEIAASHILVAYKGSKNAGDDITRSKDEAKKRAEELLEKVKAEGADFAEIAKKESDGPSKDKGGDLGTFKKPDMDEKFSEAAWKLDVGAISDIVETPFGFHIIKRTK